MDDLKVSHKLKEVVEEVVESIEGVYGKMNVVSGKEHTYLGTKIVYGEKCTVSFCVKDYVIESIEEFEVINDVITSNDSTQASAHLFDVNEKSQCLEERRKQAFHRIVAKLLFAARKGRPDVVLAIAFLATRVTKSDEDDWKKLKRVLSYLKGTIDLTLTLSANCLNTTKWWIDASYAIHSDMKGHTGGMMSLGQGAIYVKSVKQKLNTRSSTESELVGVHDVLPQIMWTRQFLECQGHNQQETNVMQDNQSAILLEKNGRMSSSQRTKHINVRYFFIKDKVDHGEVNIVFCPSENMVADFFTKPLQGAKFIKFRDKIMGN